MDSLRQIKHEIEEQGYEIDIARGRFETALQDLLNKGDLSESDHESNADEKDKLPESEDTNFDVVQNNGYAILPSRPFKKKRRKDTESKDCGFHHTFVMRMFDRSVDLAQFGDSSPLYPICRAWMLNRPHKSELLQNNKSEYDLLNEEKITGDIEVEDIDEKPLSINTLPEPEPWPENHYTFRSDPRIPVPPPALSTKKLDRVNEEVHISPALLLTEHLHRWRNIRNEWKAVGMVADNRYHKTFNLLKTMFDGPGT